MVSDMDQFGINTDCIVFHDGCHCPSSIVLCSLASGSRTIVHSNQNLPELTPTDFIGLPLDKFSWIHFEVSGARVRSFSYKCIIHTILITAEYIL